MGLVYLDLGEPNAIRCDIYFGVKLFCSGHCWNTEMGYILDNLGVISIRYYE